MSKYNLDQSTINQLNVCVELITLQEVLGPLALHLQYIRSRSQTNTNFGNAPSVYTLKP